MLPCHRQHLNLFSFLSQLWRTSKDNVTETSVQNHIHVWAETWIVPNKQTNKQADWSEQEPNRLEAKPWAFIILQFQHTHSKNATCQILGRKPGYLPAAHAQGPPGYRFSEFTWRSKLLCRSWLARLAVQLGVCEALPENEISTRGLWCLVLTPKLRVPLVSFSYWRM